jgi:hypothetical protein
LFLREALQGGVAQALPDAFLEAYRARFAELSNSAVAMTDGGLEQHLEGVISVHKHGFSSAFVSRSIEKLDSQNQTVDALLPKQPDFALHLALLAPMVAFLSYLRGESPLPNTAIRAGGDERDQIQPVHWR